MELHNLVSSLEYLVSNGRQVLLGGIRLGSSATVKHLYKVCELLKRFLRQAGGPKEGKGKEAAAKKGGMMVKDGDGFPDPKECLMIFGGPMPSTPSASTKCAIERHATPKRSSPLSLAGQNL